MESEGNLDRVYSQGNDINDPIERCMRRTKYYNAYIPYLEGEEKKEALKKNKRLAKIYSKKIEPISIDDVDLSDISEEDLF